MSSSTFSGNLVRQYRCPVVGCDALATTEFMLVKHYRAVHSKARPYKCAFPSCRNTRWYSSPSSLVQHIEKKHLKIYRKKAHQISPNAGAAEAAAMVAAAANLNSWKEVVQFMRMSRKTVVREAQELQLSKQFVNCTLMEVPPINAEEEVKKAENDLRNRKIVEQRSNARKRAESVEQLTMDSHQLANSVLIISSYDRTLEVRRGRPQSRKRGDLPKPIVCPPTCCKAGCCYLKFKARLAFGGPEQEWPLDLSTK